MKGIRFYVLMVALLLFTGLMGYLFGVSFAYKISFKTENAPWFVYHSLQKQTDVVLDTTTEDQLRFSTHLSDKKTRLEWSFTTAPGQPTKAEVYVFPEGQMLSEKLRVIIGQSKKVHEALAMVETFYRAMQSSANKYRWESPEKGELSASRCLCQKVNTTISKKANQMNRNIDALSFHLPKGEKSPPRLYINSIDLAQQTLSFDFCFQVPDDFVFQGEDPFLFVTDKPAVQGQKQTFYGNYNESHRSWFNVIQAVQHQGKTLSFPMVEVFYDSPFSETNDVNWRSELYFDTN